MEPRSNLYVLTQNVKRMLDVMLLLENHDWLKECKFRLKRLYQRLEAISLAPFPILDSHIEAEFYAIIESHPTLRHASRIVFKEELLDICKDGLAYYAELKKNRPLTILELEQLATVQKEYERVTEELDQLRQELLEK